MGNSYGVNNDEQGARQGIQQPMKGIRRIRAHQFDAGPILNIVCSIKIYVCNNDYIAVRNIYLSSSE